MRGPFKVAVLCNQHLATPNCAIASIACSIKTKTEHRHLVRQSMFSHEGSNMSVMVLHLDNMQRGLLSINLALHILFSPQCGGIARMQVTRYDLWFNAEKLLHVTHNSIIIA